MTQQTLYTSSEIVTRSGRSYAHDNTYYIEVGWTKEYCDYYFASAKYADRKKKFGKWFSWMLRKPRKSQNIEQGKIFRAVP